MISYAERLASFTSWPSTCPNPTAMACAGFHQVHYDSKLQDLVVCPDCHIEFFKWSHDDDPLKDHTTQSPECPFVRQTQLATQQKKKRNENTRKQYKRRILQLVNTEATAEKSSNIQAISTKNLGTLSRIPRQVLSTIPHRIIKQSSHPTEHITIFWPVISVTLLCHITELSTQEKDLLRRSQPNHYSHLLVKDWTNLEDLEVLV